VPLSRKRRKEKKITKEVSRRRGAAARQQTRDIRDMGHTLSEIDRVEKLLAEKKEDQNGG
jgi:hypothetical protein